MKLLPMFVAVLVLAGCASGQVLPLGAPHDKDASLLTAAGGYGIGIRLIYDYGKDDHSFEIKTTGTWVTPGDFYIDNTCIIISDFGPIYQRVHVAPGRHYKVGCGTQPGSDYSEFFFVDTGPAPSE